MKRFTFACFGLAFASVMSAQEVPRFLPKITSSGRRWRSGFQKYSLQWSSDASGRSRLHRVDRNAELAQPTHMMAYHSVSLALIQRRQPTLHIGLAGAEYLEDELEERVCNRNQCRPLVVFPALGDNPPELLL